MRKRYRMIYICHFLKLLLNQYLFHLFRGSIVVNRSGSPKILYRHSKIMSHWLCSLIFHLLYSFFLITQEMLKCCSFESNLCFLHFHIDALTPLSTFLSIYIEFRVVYHTIRENHSPFPFPSFCLK